MRLAVQGQQRIGFLKSQSTFDQNLSSSSIYNTTGSGIGMIH
jgi:hypothetical protein